MKLLLVILAFGCVFAEQSLPPTPADQEFTGKCPVCHQGLDSKLIPGSGEMTKKRMREL
jgi:hypothetical protein